MIKILMKIMIFLYFKIPLSIPRYRFLFQNAAFYSEVPLSIPKCRFLFQNAAFYSKIPLSIPKYRFLFQWRPKCCQNHCFYNIYEQKVAVARAPWCGGPPFSSHSNFIFVNVVKPTVLATFFVRAEVTKRETPPTSL